MKSRRIVPLLPAERQWWNVEARLDQVETERMDSSDQLSGHKAIFSQRGL